MRLSGQGDFRCRDGTGLGYFAFFFFLFLGCCSGVEFSQTTSNHAESPRSGLNGLGDRKRECKDGPGRNDGLRSEGGK